MWKFKLMERGIPERDPRETEFFKLRSPAEAVVREFIQNSLDARFNNEQSVVVKITFNKVRWCDVARFMDNNLKEHLRACGFLVGNEYPAWIPYLVLEDFGTTGLDGPFTPEAREGNFYNFWWREGISEKRAQKAGRWGLGKTTFHIVSKIRTFFGFTVRNDGKKLLMGKTLLKTHVLNNQRYHYFGYFSVDDFMPVEDEVIIFEFKNKFGIIRNSETGFSLVIPLPVDEINFDSLLQGTIQHYFYPILTGMLRVEIREDNRQEELNEDNLIEKASNIDWKDTEWEGMNIQEIFEFLRTARGMPPWTLNINNPNNPEITPGSFGDQLDILKNSFRSGTPVKLRVPIHIRKSNGRETDTSFTVLLKRFPQFKKPFECYIRSGILVSEIKMLGSHPVAGLLIAEDEPVCEFLGDCETPAHTNWNERTEGFAEKYTHAARLLRFIKKSMVQIVSILDEPPAERQVDFLKEIFSVPVVPESREGEEEIPLPVPPNIKKRVGIFVVSLINGGFRVTLNPKVTNLSFPLRATVRIAYDTFRGDPFANYEKFDFDVADSSVINIIAEDCNVLDRKLNKLEIEITGWNFRLDVRGFDPERDLVVDIK